MSRPSRLCAPFLKQISLVPDRVARDEFPFDTLPFLDDAFRLEFTRPIVLFVGENGSGKSTLLEAIAQACGFNVLGGSRDHRNHAEDPADRTLVEALRCAWLPKVSDGFFFRAESFFNFAGYIDATSSMQRYGGEKLQHQSHGESFLALFRNRLGTNTRAIYLLDEPESALSPVRQLEFIRVMRRWEESSNVQAIIVTHAPILMAYPGATMLDFTGGEIREIAFEDTEHYRLMRAFFADPSGFIEDVIAGR